MEKSILVGKGSGISNYLSKSLGIEMISSTELERIDLSNFDNIIYTSTDPSHFIEQNKMCKYLNKNIRSIYRIIESKFSGRLIYLSSIESGPIKVKRENLNDQVEDMFTPYSFSKYSAESLFLSQNCFKQCIVLRLGMLWPTKTNSNLFHALESQPEDINLNFNSNFYLTPYSLVLRYIEKITKERISNDIFGYLTSSNKFSLSSLLKIRKINYSDINNNKYLYLTKDISYEIKNFSTGGWYDWEKELDYNHIIASSLNLNTKEEILPSRF